MEEIIITTNKSKEIIDITKQIEQTINRSSFKEGIIHLFLTHTTAALTCADLDPGTDIDMLEAFWTMIPKLQYRHPHNPKHVPSHILSSLIGASLTLVFREKRLLLGTWQKVVLIEFDGPKERKIIINIQPNK